MSRRGTLTPNKCHGMWFRMVSADGSPIKLYDVTDSIVDAYNCVNVVEHPFWKQRIRPYVPFRPDPYYQFYATESDGGGAPTIHTVIGTLRHKDCIHTASPDSYNVCKYCRHIAGHSEFQRLADDNVTTDALTPRERKYIQKNRNLKAMVARRDSTITGMQQKLRGFT